MPEESDAAFTDRVIGEARAKAGVSAEGMDLAANALLSVVTDHAARVMVGELAAAEAEARAVLTGKVRAALESGLDGQFVDPADGESMQRAAEIAVSVFEQVLRDPPVREVQADGTEVVKWPK